MTDNTFPNDSLNPQNISSNISFTEGGFCFFIRPFSFVFTASTFTNVFFFLPLYIFVLYLGLQQWKQKGSSSSLATISHSDCFAYHTAIIELFSVVGSILIFSVLFNGNIINLVVGISFHNFSWFGQTCFHMLTCLERYLAVVHPISYMRMRNEKGVRIRNICIGCAWLLCFAGMGSCFFEETFIITNFCFLIFALSVVSFSSVSVLRALISPGPGDQVGGREKTDQSKQRAFYTILVILGVLVLRFSFDLVDITLYVLRVPYPICELGASKLWLNMPSSLVLPFLFLQRAGRVQCFKRNQSPDQE